MTDDDFVHRRSLAWARVLLALAISVAAMTALPLPHSHAASGSATKPVPLATALRSLPPAHNSEMRLQPNTVLLLRLIEKLWPYYASGGPIYGWREDPIPDHPSGQALDIMAPDDGRTPASVAQGNSIAGFLMENAEQLGINYMIWRQHIWYPGQDWRLMSDNQNWTDNHMNHIHVLVHGSYTPSGSLMAPQIIGWAGMPTLDQIRRARKQTIGLLTIGVVEARRHLSAATYHAQQVKSQRDQQATTTAATQHKIDEVVRQTYMFGADVDLVTSMAFLSDPAAIGSSTMVVEREKRSRIAAYDAAQAQLAETSRLVTDQKDEVTVARAALADAEGALAEAKNPLGVPTD